MSAETDHVTLLLRLVGPMQAWGTQSRFTTRDTGLEPSKSGVIGLMCAALGRPRQAPIVDLAALRFGVRIDREGILKTDYQTAQNVLRANPKAALKETEVSQRAYLADANFLAGLYGPRPLLVQAQAALRNPHWPLFLGRKAFVPGEPVWLADGLQSTDLLTSLKTYPWRGRAGQAAPSTLRLVLEDPAGAEVRRDQPLSFQSQARRFAPRRIRQMWVSCNNPAP